MINEEEEDDDEEEEPVKQPLYDSDPEHVALHEFLDDDEGVLELPKPAASQPAVPKKKKAVVFPALK